MDLTVWHKGFAHWPVRAIDGKWTWLDVWRRWEGNGWEYQRRDETDEEWWNRNW